VTGRTETICVVGLGLMGGSLALALREASGAHTRIVAVTRSAEVLQQALAVGAIDRGSLDLADGVSGAHTVILAAPVRAILRLLPGVGEFAARGTLLLDLGSSKAQICAAMADLPDGLQPVGGHPMCGKEVAGFASAEADLFRDRPFVLCPLPRTDPEALNRAFTLARSIGARPLVLDPAVHDRAVAGISHLPYAAAIALINCVAQADDPIAWSLASSGFRDTSRLASSEVEMMLDIMLTNRVAVIDWMEQYAAQFRELMAALAAGDEMRLRELLAGAQRTRAGRIS
jgi:prephenate dehydrogenase